MSSNANVKSVSNGESLLRSAFAKALGFPPDADVSGLEYGRSKWDSVAHVGLISAIEDTFGVVLEGDDIVTMMTYRSTLELLQNKYGVCLE